MSHILHDISVAWWAYRTKHHCCKEFRIGIIYPLTIRRDRRLELSWVVTLRKPAIFILNDPAVERDYHYRHSHPRFARTSNN